MYRTGDYASICAGGAIQYEGRTDSQIKLRGHRVDLSEIEKQLMSISHIEKGIVLCYHAGQIDQAILAFATLRPESTIQQGTQIENMLRGKLAEYMVPQVILIDKVPLLVNGKVDRQYLLKIYENTNNNGESSLDTFRLVSPLTAVNRFDVLSDDPEVSLDFDYTGVSNNDFERCKALFETIGEVIGRSTRATLSLNSSFYELGGNSLNSIFTVSKLRSKGFFIEISEFISAKNLNEMLSKILDSEKESDKIDSPIENQVQMTAYPLATEHKEDAVE